MPWSPKSEFRPDARLDPYRDRAAELVRDGRIIGHLLVRTEYVSDAPGGHLWWTRWAPYQEIPSVSIALADGYRVDDYWIQDSPSSSEFDAELQHWARNEMPLLGELLACRWLGPAQSLQVARDHFAAEDFDEAARANRASSPPLKHTRRSKRERPSPRPT